MDLTPRGLLFNWFPQIPKLLKTAVLAALGQSENSEHQDFITQVVVQAARPVLQTPSPLHAAQKFLMVDFGVWGRIWVSKYTVPAPAPAADPASGVRNSDEGAKLDQEDEKAMTVEQAVKFAIESLATTPDELACPVATVDDVEIEWVACRNGVALATLAALLPRKSERETYELMMRDLGKPDTPTILYCHGGAFCLTDPANHRYTTSTLAQHSNARVVSVRYRLSPQNIFPAALIDIFVAYLSLLAPSPNAFHDPVDPRNIVFAGDSSGANLATTLQLLLETLLKHGKHRIHWHGNTVITIPDQPSAALSLTSPYLDITRSLPSCTQNVRWDVIASPPVLNENTISTSPPFPPDDIWPASPPRTETYCTAVMCAHPLVSPLVAPKDLLRSLPPVYISVGWEGMTDEAEVFARRIWEAKTASHKLTKDTAGSNELDGGVYVAFEEYAGMLHSFSCVAFNAAGRREIASRAEHITEAVKLAHGRSTRLGKTRFATLTRSKTMQIEEVPFEELASMSRFAGYVRTESLTEESILRKVGEGRDFRARLEKKMSAAAVEKS